MFGNNACQMYRRRSSVEISPSRFEALLISDLLTGFGNSAFQSIDSIGDIDVVVLRIVLTLARFYSTYDSGGEGRIRTLGDNYSRVGFSVLRHFPQSRPLTSTHHSRAWVVGWVTTPQANPGSGAISSLAMAFNYFVICSFAKRGRQMICFRSNDTPGPWLPVSR